MLDIYLAYLRDTRVQAATRLIEEIVKRRESPTRFDLLPFYILEALSAKAWEPWL
jgi:hypothetical protein